MPKFGFSKKERLCSQKQIEQLFAQGAVVFLYPFRVSYLLKPQPDATLPQIIISIPRKNFKLATQRNQIKRRIREAYRLNKYLLQNSAHQFSVQYIAFVYVAKEILKYAVIEKKMQKILKDLAKLS
ncbi:MAG: ribonuclease P protein component [Microscillaceae bacterium]|nr:ribonuclease P protein component [Microscillaceae bacterium]MDW8459961.1 ribonuclease P protein component [Cytophagales bacterium]